MQLDPLECIDKCNDGFGQKLIGPIRDQCVLQIAPPCRVTSDSFRKLI
jgi:hypothetical protein